MVGAPPLDPVRNSLAVLTVDDRQTSISSDFCGTIVDADDEASADEVAILVVEHRVEGSEIASDRADARDPKAAKICLVLALLYPEVDLCVVVLEKGEHCAVHFWIGPIEGKGGHSESMDCGSKIAPFILRRFAENDENWKPMARIAL